MDATLTLELGMTAALAAVLGSMLGLGGGVFIVPAFTLFWGVDEKIAIGASAVAVVANSVVGSRVHLAHRFTNLRLSVVLQVATAFGAFFGALMAVNAPTRLLNGLFGLVLLFAAASMLLKRSIKIEDGSHLPDPHRLRATYYDPAIASQVSYVPQRLNFGLAVSSAAGVISGMLGVGGGVIQVPTMNLMMRVPVKAAAGTSAFMVGITAVATAFVFYSHEKINPEIVIPTLFGVFVGSRVGSRLTRRVRAERLTAMFVLILIYLGLRLLLKSLDLQIAMPW